MSSARTAPICCSMIFRRISPSVCRSCGLPPRDWNFERPFASHGPRHACARAGQKPPYLCRSSISISLFPLVLHHDAAQGNPFGTVAIRLSRMTDIGIRRHLFSEGSHDVITPRKTQGGPPNLHLHKNRYDIEGMGGRSFNRCHSSSDHDDVWFFSIS